MGVGEERRRTAAAVSLARAHGSTSRAADSTSSFAGPSAAHQTNVSRLPFGPGSPDDANP